MRWVGWILAIVAGVPFVLDWMGMLSTVLPPLAGMHIPPVVLGGIAALGVVMAMMFRRPRD